MEKHRAPAPDGAGATERTSLLCPCISRLSSSFSKGAPLSRLLLPHDEVRIEAYGGMADFDRARRARCVLISQRVRMDSERQFAAGNDVQGEWNEMSKSGHRCTNGGASCSTLRRDFSTDVGPGKGAPPPAAVPGPGDCSTPPLPTSPPDPTLRHVILIPSPSHLVDCSGWWS